MTLIPSLLDPFEVHDLPTAGITFILTGKSTGEGPLGRPRRRWEDNVRNRCQCKEMGWWGLLERACEWGFEPPGSNSHEIS